MFLFCFREREGLPVCDAFVVVCASDSCGVWEIVVGLVVVNGEEQENCGANCRSCSVRAVTSTTPRVVGGELEERKTMV